MPGQVVVKNDHNLFSNQPAFYLTPISKKKVSESESTSSGKNYLQLIVNLVVAILLSRFTIPGGICPAGTAFFITSLSRQLNFATKVFILAGVFIGTFSIKGIQITGVVCGTLTLVFLAVSIFNQVWFNKKGRPNGSKIFIYIVWSSLRVLYALFYEPSFYLWVLIGIELCITIVLTIIFQKGFSFLDNPLKAYSRHSMFALALILVLAIGGTGAIMVQSIKISGIISVFVLMIVSFIGGGGVGAAMGIAIAVVLGITTGGLIVLLATYGISGLLAGFLKDLGKWGSILGCSIGLLIIMQQLHFNPEAISNVWPWGIGITAFIFIPRRTLSYVSNYFPDGTSNNTDTSEKQRQLKEILLSRINDLAGIFAELAKSFNEEQKTESNVRKMDLYSLLDLVCTKNCQHCNGYEVCWGENFYATYREIFDLIALAELYGEVNSRHLKGRLAKSCFQQFKLLSTINQMFEKCQTEFTWQRKLDESKMFLATQLQGVSNIITSLAMEVNIDAAFKCDIEDKLRNSFNRIGMHVKELTVLSFRDEGLEIRVKQRNCNQKRECHYVTALMIGKLLGEEYSVWERKCQLEDGDCSYCLTPARNYEIKTTVCKLPKEGNEFSGDNHTLRELKDGHFVVILSDGMGHGPKAAMESNTTVSILEKLIECGIDRDFAVKMVNSVLLLRSPDESFATVDMVLIDLYTGQAEFIKIGAAASFVKRGKEVWSIKSTSLPAGILNAVDVERTTVSLQPGDLIIMATDGVIDSKENHSGKEEWMVRALRQVEVVGPEALGEYLLSLAKINQEGIPKDDMTVIVLQLQEKGILS